MRCQLCGAEFEPTAMGCQDKCPMSRQCRLICCPHCGYQVVDEDRSRLARLVEKVWSLFRRKRSRSARPLDPVPLSDVEPGSRVQLLSLGALEPARQARLIAFGLVPGSEVQLVQRLPAPVIRVGETDLALGAEMLAQIRVRCFDPAAPVPSR